MNNKGFAITSVIYGLSILGMMIVFILMGTISSSRRNVTSQAKSVESFLIHLNQASAVVNRKGGYTVPKGESGWYRFEAFGKKSASAYGAYTTGIIYIEEGQAFEIDSTGASGTEVKYDGEVIMRAQHASGTSPGGTTKCYNKTPVGGKVDDETTNLTTSTINGTATADGVIISDCASPSYIKGYPGSGLNVGDSLSQAFVDGLMLAGISDSDNGKVIITFLKGRENNNEYLEPTNQKFYNVTRINVTNATGLNVYYSCSQNYNNSSIPEKIGQCTSFPCNISGCNTLDDVSIVSSNTEATLTGITVTFTSNGSNVTVFQSNDIGGIPAGATGIHLSAYQPDLFGDSITHGNFYIIPVVTDTSVLSAARNKNDIGNSIATTPLTGESIQKWSIDLISTPTIQNYKNLDNKTKKNEYRIMDLARFKALDVHYEENRLKNNVSTSDTFNSISRNDPQLWNVTSLHDGTYAIKTIVDSFDTTARTGFLYADREDHLIKIGRAYDNPHPDASLSDEANTIPTAAERFYLYSIDLSK